MGLLPDLRLTNPSELESVRTQFREFKRNLQQHLAATIGNQKEYLLALYNYELLNHKAYAYALEQFESIEVAGYIQKYVASEAWGWKDGARDLTRRIESELKRYDDIIQTLGGSPVPNVAVAVTVGKDVFIVHGHNVQRLAELESLLRKLELNPIILKDQASGGKTVIEKFESKVSTIGFAIALLTADDEGKASTESDFKARARQNAVFELGFFYGRLGRHKTAALVDKDVELPSDLGGIITIRFSSSDWKTELIKEMKLAGLPGKWENHFD